MEDYSERCQRIWESKSGFGQFPSLDGDFPISSKAGQDSSINPVSREASVTDNVPSGFGEREGDRCKA